MENYRQFFPDLENVPPVLYFDLWPIENSTMFVVDPNLAAQFTQDVSLPKHSMLPEIMEPMSHGLDLNAFNGDQWKLWRSRFNPGFSARNIMALLPEILEEVSIFYNVLGKLAGSQKGEWGGPFQMEEITTNLTFDVIGRVILYGPLQPTPAWL